MSWSCPAATACATRTRRSSSGCASCTPPRRGRSAWAPGPALAAAGVLDGAAAATHWASAQRLTDLGITYSDQRVVRAGKVLTSAGATACIDLALTLLGLSHGPAVAQTVQLSLEYDPQPPYDAGSPAKAPAEIGALVQLLLRTKVQLMPPTQNLLAETPRAAEPDDPPLPAREHRRLVTVVAGIGLVASWFVLGDLLELGFVGHLLLAAPALAAFHTLVRRRPLRSLLARDSVTFARRWPGKLLVAVVLVLIPATLVTLSVIGDRYGRYADDSWKALLMLVVLAGSYLATRRLALTVLIGAVTVAVTSWVLAPNLAAARNGDPTVLAHLDHQASMGWLAGYHSVAVAEVDLEAAQQVRLAGIGADETTVMEVGSMTKAMTGLVIADAVRRGEIRMKAPVSTYLPQLKGSPAGAVTMSELVTHTAGYTEFGAATLRSAVWKAPLGLGFFTADSAQMTKETKEQSLDGRGRYRYSTLGSAIAGQAVAAATHLSYPGLDAHATLRATRHVAHRHRGRRSTRGGWNVADRTPGQAVGHGRLRTRRGRRLHHRRPRKTRHRPPRRDRTRHVRPEAHYGNGSVEHPDWWLLEHLHLADRPDDHCPRRTDRRLRLLSRHRPRAPQGRHRSIRCRQQRQRPGHRAPHRSRVVHRSRPRAHQHSAVAPARLLARWAGYEMLICPPSRRCAGAS